MLAGRRSGAYIGFLFQRSLALCAAGIAQAPAHQGVNIVDHLTNRVVRAEFAEAAVKLVFRDVGSAMNVYIAALGPRLEVSKPVEIVGAALGAFAADR